MRAVEAWKNDSMVPATEIYKTHGKAIFRRLPEKYWKLPEGAQSIQLYRGNLTCGELEEFSVNSSNIPKPLTAWSLSISYPAQHAGIAGGAGGNPNAILQTAVFTQDDVIFIPQGVAEREIVIGDYHPVTHPTGILYGAHNLGYDRQTILRLKTGNPGDVFKAIRKQLQRKE